MVEAEQMIQPLVGAVRLLYLGDFQLSSTGEIWEFFFNDTRLNNKIVLFGSTGDIRIPRPKQIRPHHSESGATHARLFKPEWHHRNSRHDGDEGSFIQICDGHIAAREGSRTASALASRRRKGPTLGN